MATMTIKLTRGTFHHREIPYFANTSQNIIEDMDAAEAQRLIDLGYAVKIDAPPKPPLQIFAESSEKLKSKIAELQEKLTEAEAEKEALLDSDLQDVAGITRKIDSVNGRVSSLQALIQRQQIKLIRAERAEAAEAEKATVKQFAETTKQQHKEVEKVLLGINEAAAALEQHINTLSDLRDSIKQSFTAAGGGYNRSPLHDELSLPDELRLDTKHLQEFQDIIKTILGRLEPAANRAPEKLRNLLNAKHFKTENELSAEAREYELKKMAEPETIKIVARTQDWKVPDGPPRLGDEADPSTYAREIHNLQTG